MISYDFQFTWLLIFVLGVVLLILNYFFFIVTKISKVIESRWSLLKFRSHGQRSRTICWSLSHVFSNNMYSLHLSYSTRFNVGYPESADVCKIENAKFLCIMYFMCRVICVSSLVCFKLTWAESSIELFWSPVVRPLSVCPSMCLSVRLSVNFSHFHLLLQNHWAIFNQIWHNVSLGEGYSSFFMGEGDSSLFKWTVLPFSKGR